MYFEDLALGEEVLLNSKSAVINKYFHKTLKDILTPQFYYRVDKSISGRINVFEDDLNNNVVAYSKSGQLFVNAPVFYTKPRQDALVYVLHELIHLLARKPQFFVIRSLEKKLWKLVKKNLVKPYSEFLTGKKQPLHSIKSQEVLTYLMNKSLDFTAVKPHVKDEYIRLVRESGIFNLDSDYFKFLNKK
jgi:hypothetical protein